MEIFQNDPSDSLSIPDDLIHHLYEDYNGSIWITTAIGGIARFDKKTKRFYSVIPPNFNENGTNWDTNDKLAFTKKNELWISLWVYGLVKYTFNSPEPKSFDDLLETKYYGRSANSLNGLDTNFITTYR